MHEFGEAVGDGEAETGAAEAARGSGIDLGEGPEEAVHPVGRDADAGVADAEVELEGLAGGDALDGEEDLAAGGELDRVADEVEEDLLEARAVAQKEAGDIGIDKETKLEVLLLGLGAAEVEDGLDDGADVDRGVLELDAAGLDLGVVEDVVDDGEEGVAAVADGAEYSRCSRVSSVLARSWAMPRTPFIGVRISWLMTARKALLAWLAASAARASSSEAWMAR
jgi:hypothetical protein